MNQIIPAILPKTQSELNEKVQGVLGLVDLIQIDVCDGIFVPSKTEFSELLFVDQMNYELDLMVTISDTSVLDTYIALKPKSIVLHLESLADPMDCIRYVKSAGIEVSLSISNDTPSEFLLPFFPEISSVQLMGIATIGSQAQPFDDRVLEKIAYLKNNFSELNITIDGSVNVHTIAKLRDAGADRFICGSAVFSDGDVSKNIRVLEKSDTPPNLHSLRSDRFPK